MPLTNTDRFDANAAGDNTTVIARQASRRSDIGAQIANGHRTRVSLSRTLLGSRFAYDIQPEIFSEVENVNGSVDYIGDRDAVDLSIGTAAGDKLTFSTNEYFHYQSYRETHIGLGFTFPTPQQGLRARLGAFYEANGIYLEQAPDGAYNAVLRRFLDGSLTEIRIPQKDWNVDTFDGSGNYRTNPSGIKIDFSLIQMLKIGFEWYGAGDAWIGFKLFGEVLKAHVFYAGNVMSEPVFGEPSLPIQYEIENVNPTGAPSAFRIFGASASAETGDTNDDVGFHYSASRGRNPIAVTNTLKRVFTIRPKLTHKGKVNRVKIEPLKYNMHVLANDVQFLVKRDVPITNTPTWVDAGVNSAVEYSIDAEGVDAGADRLEDYAAAGGNKSGEAASLIADNRNPLVLNADGTNDDVNLAIFCRTLANNSNAEVYSGIRWKEIQ